VAALAGASAAAAAWPLSAAAGAASARAGIVGRAAAPAAGPVSGVLTKSVPLTWSAVAGATAYTVRRYDATTGIVQPGGGTCAAPTTNSCTDTNVPPALTWRYTVEATHRTWSGGEGAATIVST
jgi:hypothetical protein